MNLQFSAKHFFNKQAEKLQYQNSLLPLHLEKAWKMKHSHFDKLAPARRFTNAAAVFVQKASTRRTLEKNEQVTSAGGQSSPSSREESSRR